MLRRATGPTSLELPFSTRTGRRFPTGVMAAAALDRSGTPIGLRWIVRDVTVEQRAQQEIREVNADLEVRVAQRAAELEDAYRAQDEDRKRLRRLLERLHEGVVAVDHGLRIEFANQEARRILSPAPLSVGDSLPEPWEELSLAEFAAALFAPGAVTSEERVRPGEGAATYSVVGIPAEGTDAALLVLADISEAERRERAQRDFVTNAAHELRTPLAVITSAIEVLQGGAKELPVERERFLEHIERQAARLTRLARALLVLARAQGGDEPPRLELIELEPLLEEAAASFEPAVGVAVEVDCPGTLAIVANRDLAAQALASLASNAGKYTREGKIVLGARRDGDRVAIEVCDTGPGIPRAERELVLRRFYRGEREGDGFGLGLSIASEAVRALGGELELDSETGRGTTARITLPAAELVNT